MTRQPITTVWTCGQLSPRTQRLHRYTRSSIEHPAKMFPHIARHAIAAYTSPGDLVVDPMCGIGTTLVEAIELGRPAIGIEYEPAWTGTAAANLYLARQRVPDAPASDVITGDARQLPVLLPQDAVGRVKLILTSPPYGQLTHGRVRQNAQGRILKLSNRYGPHRNDRSQLAHRGLPALIDGLTEVFTACGQVLAPDGLLVLAVRPWVEQGRLVDFPSMMVDAATTAGLAITQRCAAILARWNHHTQTLEPHHTFFALHNTRQARANGRPAHLIVHEDILVFGRRTV